MTENKREDDLRKTQKFYDFLRGQVPAGYCLAESEMPRLSADQASTVIWYLANLYDDEAEQKRRSPENPEQDSDDSQ